MRTTLEVWTAAFAIGVVALLAGCSGAGSQSSTSTIPNSVTTQTQARAFRNFILPSGVDTRYARATYIASASLPAQRAPDARLDNPMHRKKVEKDLFVCCASDSGIAVLKDKTYKEVREITSGLDSPDGVWVDKHGNVYVANVSGPNVTEYKPGASSPSCTYSTGLFDPINVTTDDVGNVYVADFNDLKNPGYIYKYAQCSNTISTSYSVSSGPEGVAVDKSGDIFVSYDTTSFTGAFEEFKGGSSTPTPLGATDGSPGGLILDQSGNLIADDQKGSIDVIAPPYSGATTLVGGLSDPFHCSLNQKENLLFNANNGSANVTVYSYPSGTLVTTLGSANDIKYGMGVGESPDAVF